MKSIARITRRLISLFLVLVVSSIMFLPSPAIAATSSWITINSDNLETELLDSSESAIVLLTSQESQVDVLEKLKPQTEKFYGDKYKYVSGTIEENRYLYNNVLVPPIYPPLPGILAFKNGEPLRGIFVNPNDPTPAFEFIKTQLNTDS